MNELSPRQLRITLDYLYDGDPQTYIYLKYLDENYINAHAFYLWLVRNKIRGTKLAEFFKTESGESSGHGLLRGANYINLKLYGKKLHASDLK